MIHVAVGILMHDGRVLACQRRKTARYPLKWEFPGGKIEKGETAHHALVRELKEELDIDARPDGTLLTHDWIYPEDGRHATADGAFRVTYFLVRHFTGQLVNRTFEEIRWVTPGQLEKMDLLAGNHEAIDLLLRRKRMDGSPL